MQDWAELFRPRKMDDILGQNHLKPVIYQTLLNEKFPKLSLIAGPTGTGKSSIAEFIAMAKACQNSITEPCCQCDNCKSFLKGSSRIIRKYNMAKMLQKSDAVAVIHEIFDYESIDGLSVFILEEIHELPASSQAPFLEELTKIPEDIYIIMCTTKPYKIIDEMRSRATIFTCEVPSVAQCKEYVKKVCRTAQITVPDDETIKTLVNICENNPRKIIQTLQLFSSGEPLTSELLTSFFGLAPTVVYIDLLEKLLPTCSFSDYCEFIVGLSDSDITAVKVVKGFRDFMVDVLLSRSNKKYNLIGQGDRLRKIIDMFGEAGLLRIMNYIAEYDFKYFGNESSAKYYLIHLKMEMNNSKANNSSNATVLQIEAENKARKAIERSNTSTMSRSLSAINSHSVKQQGTTLFTED